MEEHCLHNDERIEELQKATAANDMEHQSFRRRLSDLEVSSKRQNDILLALQRQGDAIESMGKKIDNLAGSINNTAKRLEAIEKEPADRYKKLSYEVIKYIVLAIMGVAVGYFIKGV